ncbi:MULTISPECIES: replication initiation negative regulator SeqA [Vibrio]|jgi:negative modulator of initiation of replication|uniref:Negative modulator of initiation of replication n=2 Tax=Vibrio TaxID=662 RepID=A0A120DGH3_9VIBR|nr:MULTISPECIES: replication initiation negative regulator SeqA [Vibrio]KAB0464425.1 replication initiation negative regulator SeqA [Vibrio kanaloae]KWU00876.1 replication initiation regulator SeqA [Vibrio toranzoniae]MCG9556740.1 replication initiation negative regulator SeqA [Vibrio kanaloae]NAZ46125.1 replication initiation negative regulator SeqA [Vibrio toranzoniae]NAZ54292.1 replication initiation negative regulator SeqA [Vibrio toranzoniae]
MKTIEVDEDLYRFIAGQTERIGESASDILRRLLQVDSQGMAPIEEIVEPKGIVVSKEVGFTPEKVDGVKEMRSLLISDEFASLKKAIDRFMLVLSTLHKIDPESFSEATQVKGRKRVYFADNEATLLENGNTTKPKAIPQSPFWVITNNNTSRKRQMVEQLMSRMSFQAELIEKVTGSI